MENEKKSTNMMMGGHEEIHRIADGAVAFLDNKLSEEQQEEVQTIVREHKEMREEIRRVVDNEVRMSPRRMCSEVVAQYVRPLNPRQRKLIYHKQPVPKKMRIIKALPPMPSEEQIKRAINSKCEDRYLLYLFARDLKERAFPFKSVRVQMRAMVEMLKQEVAASKSGETIDNLSTQKL